MFHSHVMRVTISLSMHREADLQDWLLELCMLHDAMVLQECD